METFEEYVTRVSLVWTTHQGMRSGQVFWNEVPDSIMSEHCLVLSQLDPFHDNNNIAPFLAYLVKVWPKGE